MQAVARDGAAPELPGTGGGLQPPDDLVEHGEGLGHAPRRVPLEEPGPRPASLHGQRQRAWLGRQHAPRRGGPAPLVAQSPEQRVEQPVERSPGRPEQPAHLEHGDARGALADVVPYDLQQALDQRRAHRRGVLGQRVGEHDGVAARVDAVEVVGPDEGPRDRLVQAEGPHRLPDVAIGTLGGREATGDPGQRQGRRDAVVAVQAGDLLGDVGGAADVGAPRRWGDRQLVVGLLDGAAEVAQQLGLARRVRLVVQPEEPADPARRHRDAGTCHVRAAVAADPAVGRGAHVLDELDRTGAGPFGTGGVDAPLEPGGRLGDQAEPTRGAADRRRVPRRRLEHHRGGVVGDLGRGTTHDPAQAHRTLGVRDDQVIGMQVALDVVQGRQDLALAGPAHAQLGAGQGGQVVGVHGLAELEHDQVGHVDERADGPDPALGEALPYPPGRRVGQLQVLQRPRHELRAPVEGLDGHGHVAPGYRRGDLGQPYRSGAGEGGDLTGDPEDREVVAAVGHDLDVDDRLPQRHQVVDVDPQRRGRVQDHDAAVVVAELELAGRGQHAVGRDAPDLARAELEPRDRPADLGVDHDVVDLEVPRAADQLDLVVAVGDPHDLQLVRVGVGFAVQHAGGHDVAGAGARGQHPVDLQPGAADELDELVEVHGHVDELGEPGQRDPHEAALLAVAAMGGWGVRSG